MDNPTLNRGFLNTNTKPKEISINPGISNSFANEISRKPDIIKRMENHPLIP